MKPPVEFWNYRLSEEEIRKTNKFVEKNQGKIGLDSLPETPKYTPQKLLEAIGREVQADNVVNEALSKESDNIFKKIQKIRLEIQALEDEKDKMVDELEISNEKSDFINKKIKIQELMNEISKKRKELENLTDYN